MSSLNILNQATIISPAMLFGYQHTKVFQKIRLKIGKSNCSTLMLLSHTFRYMTLYQYINKTPYNGFGKQWSARSLHFDTNTEQIHFQLISLHCYYPKSISRVITRLSIGHMRLTHKHLTNRQPQPLRRACNTKYDCALPIGSLT